MNRQKQGNRRGIEWTDFTWNPVKGCLHNCQWQMPDGSWAGCYAKDVAEGIAKAAYPHKFAHHYFDEKALGAPLKQKKPARIFLDSMSDLMGHWVPDEQVQQVLDVVWKTPHHDYQLLTKNARRLKSFDLPPNLWAGVSLPPTVLFKRQIRQDKLLKYQLETLAEIKTPVRWMSMEPLSFDVAQHLGSINLQWIVIGAASNGKVKYQPEKMWVRNLLDWADMNKVKVFFKGNLEWPHGRWREDFPAWRGFLPVEKYGHLLGQRVQATSVVQAEFNGKYIQPGATGVIDQFPHGDVLAVFLDDGNFAFYQSHNFRIVP